MAPCATALAPVLLVALAVVCQAGRVAADLPDGIKLKTEVDPAVFLANQPNRCSRSATANKGYYVRDAGCARHPSILLTSG